MHGEETTPRNPDARNATTDCEYQVRIYFKTGREHEFPARDIDNARDIAARCSMEYVWIAYPDSTEEFYPPHTIHKVKIVPIVFPLLDEELARKD